MMAVNRYRVKTLAEQGHRSARLVLRLLEKPDRLLGTILFGNNIANIVASTIATLIGLRLYGDAGLAYAPLVLVFIILIFAEVAPKTLAAIHSESIALPASYILWALQWLFAAPVRLVKVFSNGLLRLFRVEIKTQSDALSTAELSAVVRESGQLLQESHQEMLLRILGLEQIRVEDVMVPRKEMEAIDLDDEWDDIVTQLATSHHTRVPVYRGSMDDIVGIIHIRKLFYLSQLSELDREGMDKMIRKPYFIPENSSITHALANLREQRRRFGIVVDEYGDVKGLVTLEHILEEVVGEFTTLVPGMDEDIKPTGDGAYLVRGTTYLRDINRRLDWALPVKTAKTVNGIITDLLEDIPQAQSCCRIGNYVIEIVQTKDAAVHEARIKLLKPLVPD